MREVNGQQYSHSTVVPRSKSTGGEFRLRTATRISYSEEVPSEATTDAQGQRDGFTYGVQDIPNAEIEMKLSEWLSWRAQLLTDAGGLGVTQSIFDMPVSYGNNVNALKVDTLQGCHVVADRRESSQDGGALMVTVPIFVTSIDWADGPFVVYED